jgi:hypothetical protein
MPWTRSGRPRGTTHPMRMPMRSRADQEHGNKSIFNIARRSVCDRRCVRTARAPGNGAEHRSASGQPSPANCSIAQIGHDQGTCHAHDEQVVAVQADTRGSQGRTPKRRLPTGAVSSTRATACLRAAASTCEFPSTTQSGPECPIHLAEELPCGEFPGQLRIAGRYGRFP